MKTLTEITDLANAATIKAAESAIERAESTDTPIIVWEDGQIKELDPQEARRRLNANRPAED